MSFCLLFTHYRSERAEQNGNISPKAFDKKNYQKLRYMPFNNKRIGVLTTAHHSLSLSRVNALYQVLTVQITIDSTAETGSILTKLIAISLPCLICFYPFLEGLPQLTAYSSSKSWKRHFIPPTRQFGLWLQVWQFIAIISGLAVFNLMQ